MNSLFSRSVALSKRLPIYLSILGATNGARLFSSNIPRLAASHWTSVPMAPADKILGLSETFKADPAADKVDLIVGAYRDENGKPHVLDSVREAERRIVSKNMDHEYAGIAGIQSFINASLEFIYGTNSLPLKEGRVAAIQSLSGTGGCRVAAEFVAQSFGRGTKVYLPNPTWSNHLNIMRQAGLVPEYYPYYHAAAKSFDFTAMMKFVKEAPEKTVFLLHACAHNPTGCDPTHAQWDQMSALMRERNHVVFIDCAYQGFATGDAERDAYAVRKFVEDGHNIILSQSFAKNFGLYGERIGAISIVSSDKEEKDRVLSQLKMIARPMYSNPPVYGARVVSEILGDSALRAQWTAECKGMASRIQAMRQLLRTNLEQLQSKQNWEHITNQIGMFCYTGLNIDQVQKVRSKHHIYFTDDGRISMAGVNSKNVGAIAKAFHDATK